MRPVELAGLAREVLALHEGMAQQRGVRLELSGGPAEASCDARKVKQVLMNLLQNALEASPPGAAVEVRVLPPSPERVSVHVLDRGGGLDIAARSIACQGKFHQEPSLSVGVRVGNVDPLLNAGPVGSG